jgi:hypothetical protein
MTHSGNSGAKVLIPFEVGAALGLPYCSPIVLCSGRNSCCEKGCIFADTE